MDKRRQGMASIHPGYLSAESADTPFQMPLLIRYSWSFVMCSCIECQKGNGPKKEKRAQEGRLRQLWSKVFDQGGF